MNPSRQGRIISLITAILTIITFGIAVCTPPLSGPFCQGSCFEYPYIDITSRFPRDYIWMFPAMLVSLMYLLLMIAIEQSCEQKYKLFGKAGICFALMSAIILVLDYFVQISVIQPSLLRGEKESIGILSQFNPHGIFIAMEEIGFLMMSFSFAIVTPIFSRKVKGERAVRLVFEIAFLIAVIALAAISFKYGILREYRFEVFIISVNWLVLIINGFLLMRYFKNKSVEKILE